MSEKNANLRNPGTDENRQTNGVSPCDWEETVAAFFYAIADDQRPAVERAVTDPRYGGAGLRRWLEGIVWLGEPLPDWIPASVIDVYLRDPAAMPLFNCEDCDMPVPVRPHPIEGPDAAPEQIYFPHCPWCGAPTGRVRHTTGVPAE